jgi:pyruvate dehydrogenase E1 component beta subunit
VIDLRTVCPLDASLVCETVARSRRLLVVDEDYQGFGLSGELAAIVLEAGIPFRYARVCTTATIPYARHLEDQALPNVERILRAGMALIQG